MISKNNYNHTSKLSLDNVCVLRKATFTEDSVGNQIPKYTEREVFCAELPVYSAEFYKSSQQGIKLQKILVIDLEEYDKEMIVIYENEAYSIFKTFTRSDGLIELCCCEKVGV